MCEDNKVAFDRASVTVKLLGPSGGVIRFGCAPTNDGGASVGFYSTGPLWADDHVWDLTLDQVRALILGLELILDRLEEP